MMADLFGSDGIRGAFGETPITAKFMRSLGFAAGKVLSEGGSKTKCFIGRDTRASSEVIEGALLQGLRESKVAVTLGGVLPSPAVAFHVADGKFDFGICVTASHNPASHNGVKIFDHVGSKLSGGAQDKIAAFLQKEGGAPSGGEGINDLGTIDESAAKNYADFCLASLPIDTDFTGLKLVLDAANGAASAIAPAVFTKVGAEVIAIGAAPDGSNINLDCGALNPEVLTAKVQQSGAAVGMALDGDGDRLLLVDAMGTILDGDDLLFIIATHLNKLGMLGGGVVGTQTTNSGLATAFAAMDIPFARAEVGDRHVLAMMRDKGWQLGGEQSGHLILLDLLPSSDAVLTALKVISLWWWEHGSAGKPLSGLTDGWQRRPTETRNVTPPAVVDLDAGRAAVDRIKAELDTDDYVLIRASGTENVIRILVETNERAVAEQAADELARVVSQYGFAKSTLNPLGYRRQATEAV